ncbi:MAG: hypothetical protein QT11_C0001G0311 [archaeon GW2011_AR20]|nr:MAG: hypothetical protein QT11_C0001G0311 [archaeon GW2011_AR20]AQS28479.1 hypothetical protein [uncultured archaeon]MBS3160319.1 hypothetical protein [Candidatus Woesearchaeota archaeon]
MTKKAECDLIYTCEDRTQIYVAKGNLSKWDFRVGFLKEGMKGTPRFAKHLHIATEFYIKHAHNPELAKKFKEYFVGLLDKVEPIDYYPPKIKFFDQNKLEEFEDLNEVGEFSVEFLMVYIELLMTQEKTNYAPMFFNRKLFNDLFVKNRYSVMNTASQRGKKK